MKAVAVSSLKNIFGQRAAFVHIAKMLIHINSEAIHAETVFMSARNASELHIFYRMLEHRPYAVLFIPMFGHQ